MISGGETAPAGRRGRVLSLVTMVAATLLFSLPALRPGMVFAGLDFTTSTDPFIGTELAS